MEYKISDRHYTLRNETRPNYLEIFPLKKKSGCEIHTCEYQHGISTTAAFTLPQHLDKTPKN